MVARAFNLLRMLTRFIYTPSVYIPVYTCSLGCIFVTLTLLQSNSAFWQRFPLWHHPDSQATLTAKSADVCYVQPALASPRTDCCSSTLWNKAWVPTRPSSEAGLQLMLGSEPQFCPPRVLKDSPQLLCWRKRPPTSSLDTDQWGELGSLTLTFHCLQHLISLVCASIPGGGPQV